jgi:hypothetical protein
VLVAQERDVVLAASLAVSQITGAPTSRVMVVFATSLINHHSDEAADACSRQSGHSTDGRGMSSSSIRRASTGDAVLGSHRISAARWRSPVPRPPGQPAGRSRGAVALSPKGCRLVSDISRAAEYRIRTGAVRGRAGAGAGVTTKVRPSRSGVNPWRDGSSHSRAGTPGGLAPCCCRRP